MVIFHSYVKLPDGTRNGLHNHPQLGGHRSQVVPTKRTASLRSPIEEDDMDDEPEVWQEG